MLGAVVPSWNDAADHSILPALTRTRMPVGSVAFESAMSDRRHGNLRAFYTYWQSKQADQRPPRRADIDPIDIPKLLPNVLLIDVVGTPAYDFHYRLLGTAIAAFDGIEYRGSMLSQMVPRNEAFHTIWEHHLNAAAGAVELRYDSLLWSRDNSRDHVDYLILLLPLRRLTEDVEFLFGYVHYFMDDAPPPLPG